MRSILLNPPKRRTSPGNARGLFGGLQSFSNWFAAEIRKDPVQWFGYGIALMGALLLSQANSLSRYGWILFLVSNVLVVYWAYCRRYWAVLIAQLGFTYTSVNGILNTFVG